MHIVVIGWLFVAVMMTIGERSITGAVVTFFMWGVVPMGLILYIFGRRRSPDTIEKTDDTTDESPH